MNVHSLQVAYADAVSRKDVEGLLRLYADDVRVFDAWEAWEYVGKAPWRRAIEGWFSALGTESVAVSFAHEIAHSGDPLSTLTTVATYAALAPDGTELRCMQNRITWIVRRTGVGWQIIHEHTSAPIGFEDMKAILHRRTA